jgi:Ca2+-transporting ATPase
MAEAPRNPKDSLFANGGLITVGVFGTVIGVITLLAFLYAPIKELMDMGMSISISNIDEVLSNDAMLYRTAQTYAFTTLGISQLFNAMGFRNMNRSIFRINPFNNKMMIVAFCLGLLLQVAVTELPFLIHIFETVSLSLTEWIELFILSTVPIWVHEVFVLVRWATKKGKK